MCGGRSLGTQAGLLWFSLCGGLTARIGLGLGFAGYVVTRETLFRFGEISTLLGVSVQITPATTSLSPGGTQLFRATTAGTDIPLRWTADCGTVPGENLVSITYLAPASGGVTCKVTATLPGAIFVNPSIRLSQATASVTVLQTQNDAGLGTDAGNSYSTATNISPNRSYQGQLTGTTDSQDFYSFTVLSGQTITATLTPPSNADFDLSLYDSVGVRRAISIRGTGLTDTIAYTADIGGSWRIRIYQYSGTGTYTFSIYLTQQNDCQSGSDAGNTWTSATLVPLNITCQGQLTAGDTDYFQFSVTTGQTITITMTPPTGSDFDIALYDSSGVRRAISYRGTGQTEQITFTVDITGNWRIRIIQYSGTGFYNLQIT